MNTAYDGIKILKHEAGALQLRSWVTSESAIRKATENVQLRIIRGPKSFSFRRRSIAPRHNVSAIEMSVSSLPKRLPTDPSSVQDVYVMRMNGDP
jgi:hypothetical protein